LSKPWKVWQKLCFALRIKLEYDGLTVGIDLSADCIIHFLEGWFDMRDFGAVLGFDSYAGSSSRIWGLSCRREFNNDWRTLIFPLCSILPL
jgi:hypothetical protein